MDQLPEEIELSSQSLYRTLAILNNDTYSPGIDPEEGIDEVLGRRAWIILVHNAEMAWTMRIRHIWLRTLLLLLVLHPGLCILGEILWLYTFEPFSASEFKRILSYLYRDIKAASTADATTFLLQIPRVVYELKLEICILLLSVLLLTSLSRALKKRVNVCARVCTQVIVDPSKVDLEALEFAPQSTCIADIEAAFLRILYSPAQHSQAINIPQTSVVQVGALNTIGSTTLYNLPFCAFFHCPLIALVCFLKYSMVPLLVSALGLGDNSSEHDSLPPMFIFSLIFGTIYTFALLAVAVIWALFAYHHLPTVEDICSNIVKDINLFVSS